MFLEVFLFCVLVGVVAFSFKTFFYRLKSARHWQRTERIARRHERNSAGSDSFVNTTYVETESGIFPGAPPPYSHVESPPKYEDIIKSEVAVTIDRPPPAAAVREPPPNVISVPLSVAPPPYTITV